jgi:hypothetical protein
MKPFIQTTLLSVLAFICFMGSSFAQTISDSVINKTDSSQNETLVLITDSALDQTIPPRRSHFEAGMSFQSNDVYLGRKDSTVLPYYIPEFTYYHKSGLYVSASLYYLKNATASRIDLVTLEAGYKFNSGKYDGQFTASKYFYNSQSTSVTSEISASLAYQNSFDLGFIKPTFEGTLNVGSKLDFAALFGIEHTFYFFEDKLDITPTFATNASTQNYYSDYYKKRRYTIKSKKQQAQTGIESISGTVINASTFKILDFEPSLPINYRIGKCTINFTPTYSIPVHPATIAIQTVKQNGTVIDRNRIETIENTFYWTLGATFLF